jgi:hypothetical protein
MPTSKVTKLVQRLEFELKMILLVRTTRQVSLTEQGNYLFQQAQDLLEEWDCLYNKITEKQQAPSGILVIAGFPDVLTDKPFIDWLLKFSQQYPTITLRTLTQHQAFDFTHSEMDIFIGRDHQILDTSAIIAKKLLPFHFNVYAAPAYLKTHKKITTPVDLINHNCLIFSHHNKWEFADSTQKVRGNISADNSNMLLEMAAAGNGLVRTADFRTQVYRQQKKLVAILQKYEKPAPLSYNLYYKKLLYQPQRIKLFIEHMLQMRDQQ